MSIFGDFFEQFRRGSGPGIPVDIPQDILNDLYNDSLEEDRGKESSKHTVFDDRMDFMSEFEEIFNNFFKGFPAMAFPLPNENHIQSLPEREEIDDSNSTLQERMLNDKKSHNHSHLPSQQFPFSVDGVWRPDSRFNERITREDRNLDEDLKAGGKSLDDILPRGDVQPNPSPSSSYSFSGSFTSSSTTRDANGVVERKKTVRDSRGNEEVTITRIIDDKEYTITHKKDEHGNKETRENIVELGTEKNRLEVLAPERSPITSRPPSLYARLRSWFFNED